MLSSLLSDLIQEAHDNSKNHGFHDVITGEHAIPVRLVLIHSELSEALEEYRRTPRGAEEIPDAFVEELADVAIRLFDLVGFEDIGSQRFIDILLAKMVKNKSRPKLHGNKRI